MQDGNQQEITDFCSWVIEQDCDFMQGYYINFKIEKSLHYDPGSRMLSIDVKLPGIRQIPDVEYYQYEEKKDNVKGKRMTQSNFKALYNHIICDIVLRIICVIYESDEYELVDNVVINGYRIYLDRSRGKHINDCIISVSLNRKDYNDIYLRNADGEEVVRRINNNVSADMTSEPIRALPLYDSGNLNVYYVRG